ncbi:MAG: SRPBCC domain-containing protein [Acidimicrobiales bacterium]
MAVLGDGLQVLDRQGLRPRQRRPRRPRHNRGRSDPRPGGACVVELGGGGRMRGEFVELVPHERIVFSFGWEATEGAPPIAPGLTLVEVTFTADGEHTVLVLGHTGLPGSARDEHRSGWGHFLPLLATAITAAKPA